LDGKIHLKLHIEVRAESVVTTFLPSVFFATGEMPEDRPKLRPKSVEEEILVMSWPVSEDFARSFGDNRSNYQRPEHPDLFLL
jgi:hypothetical protein